MYAFPRILTGAAGLAMVAGVATPAAAQYGYGYPGGGNVVGQVINQVLGGGRYGAYGQGNDRYAVERCAQAAVARVARTSYGYAYNRGYSYGQYGAGVARVTAITRVERRSNGGLKVYGVMDSGMGVNRGAYGGGYGGYGGGYGYNQAGDLRFDCKVDYRGYVTNVDINRNTNAYYRGY